MGQGRWAVTTHGSADPREHRIVKRCVLLNTITTNTEETPKESLCGEPARLEVEVAHIRQSFYQDILLLIEFTACLVYSKYKSIINKYFAELHVYI